MKANLHQHPMIRPSKFGIWTPANGGQLASASSDKTIIIWDLTTGRYTSTLEGHSHSVTSITWSHNGSRLASASKDNTVRMWDPATGQCMSTLKGHGRSVTSIAWLQDESRLASASDDSTVRIWDLATGQCASILKGHSDSVHSVAWSPDRSQLATASSDKTIRIWDPAAGQCTSTLKRHSSSVYSITWSQDGSQLASVSDDNTVRIWDPATGRCASTLKGHNHLVTSISWLQDGSRLASASYDKTVRIWDLTTGQCAFNLEGHSGEVHSIAWSQDQGRLASGSDDKTIRIWDLATGECALILEGHSGSVHSIAWSRDGSRLASASFDDTVRIWDLTTGQCALNLEGHSNFVRSVIWSQDQGRLASGSDDKTIRIWDLATGEFQNTHYFSGYHLIPNLRGKMAAVGIPRPNRGSAPADRGENQNFAVPRPTKNTVNNKHAKMDQLIAAANAVIRHMENTGQDEPIVTRFAITVRQFAEEAKKGSSGAQGEMATVISTLEAIAADTQRLNTRIDSLEKSASSSVTSTSTLSSTDRWKAFRAGAWRTTPADPPINRSDGTASPGVTEVELREDRSITVKVDPTCRDKVRQMEAKTIVDRAEQLREKQARKRISAALAGNAYFCAARVLPSGDVSMLVNSAAGAELLRRHTDWVSLFGRVARIQSPSWGVVVHGLPIRSFKLTPESRAGLVSEIQRQNALNWGGKAEIMHLDWLTRPRENQREASVVMEFDNPAVANQAIDQGLYWNSEVHSVVFFCRDGRVKLCRKCQKPGHVQYHCPNRSFVCGHCADEHPTWECPSASGSLIRIKCANCSGSHRPTSLDCPVKREAKAKAERIRAECPPYHRVPLHLRAPREPAAPAAPPPPPAASIFNFMQPTGLGESVHAPASQPASQPARQPATQPAPQPASQPRARGRPKGSKNKSKTSTFSDKSLPTQPELTENALSITKVARNSRSQQTMLQDPISDPERLLQHKKRRLEAPQDVMDEDQELRAPSPVPSPARPILARPAPARPAPARPIHTSQALLSEYAELKQKFGIQSSPAREPTRLRLLPPHPPAPAPTEETLPSHGLHFSDIIDADAYHFGSTPPEPEPEDEFFHEASEYSEQDDHDETSSSSSSIH
ncbi:uncharacterized protein N7484_000036 [Penicillium longicatenatum]|uniref:uncharacterized protein n=1 Tax=Penicillium longicatenatum TaxID=1561947 RepID=UPI002547FA9C|nr:uncharacterized protein N7484_000036 [Penicillium longicatenatum]KAJ5660664.1 hypothetical protein N7484_000036 [Penicillium longicatenatum]